MQGEPMDYDLLFIGGGPAGAACAYQLNQHQIKCLILDKAIFPRSKPCAGWLTPSVFDSLQIQPDEYPYGLTQFASFKISLRGIKFRLPTHQYAIRRNEFDTWLLERAGVDCIHHKVQKIERLDNGFLIDDQFSAKYLIGAGGTHCPVRQAFFKREPSQQLDGLILAKEEEFPYPHTSQHTHLWFFEKGLPGYTWYVPKSNGYINVGVGAKATGLKTRGRTIKDYWDQFVIELAKSGLVNDHEYHPLGYSYYLRHSSPQLRSGNAFLIGDALGIATLDMGEGIAPAIQSGLLAADAIIHNNEYSIKSIKRYSLPSLLQLRH